MNNIVVGDSFEIGDVSYCVKKIGKFKSNISGKEKQYKTVTISNNKEGSTKFYYFFGIHGNPKSRNVKSDIKQYKFLRDVEGLLLVDVLNQNNKFHNPSKVFEIANRKTDVVIASS
jgi:hypothetical protein